MQKLFAIIALLCIAHQPLHAQVVQELNTRSAVKVMVVKDGIGIPQVAALPTNPALLNYNSTAATGSPVWCSCAADTLRRGLNIWNGTAWETIRAAELPGTINWLDSTGETQGRPLFTTVGNKTTTSPYYLFSSALRKLVINSTNISYGGLDKRLAVNGAAFISDLYLDGQLINTGPPSGSTTYPLGWNPSTQQVEKYTEWPGGISYPLSPGKYLNAYGTFAPLISDSVAEGSTNRYFTDARARAAISLTTTGSSGAATYNSSTGVLNIPAYSIGGLGGVPTSRTITINGTTYDLSADRSWTISGGGGGGITGIGAFASVGDAKGLSISGTDLIMHPATATTPGGVSTGAQTWAGPKTLNNTLTINPGALNAEKLVVFNNGSARYGIGMTNAAPFMQVFFPAAGGLSFNTGSSMQPAGVNEAMRIDGAGVTISNLNVGAFSQASFTNAAGRKLSLYNANTSVETGIGISTDINTPALQFYVPGAGGFSWNNSGQPTTAGSSEWMRLVNGALSIGSTSPISSAILSATSTTRGFLPPRMNSSQANAIIDKAEGLLVYVTDTGGSPFNFTGKGWWGWNGTTWEKLNP